MQDINRKYMNVKFLTSNCFSSCFKAEFI